jgi:hypothetical protein
MDTTNYSDAGDSCLPLYLFSGDGGTILTLAMYLVSCENNRLGALADFVECADGAHLADKWSTNSYVFLYVEFEATEKISVGISTLF